MCPEDINLCQITFVKVFLPQNKLGFGQNHKTYVVAYISHFQSVAMPWTMFLMSILD